MTMGILLVQPLKNAQLDVPGLVNAMNIAICHIRYPMGFEANDTAAINHTVRHLFQNFLWVLHMHKKGMTDCQIILLAHIGLLNIAFNKRCFVREGFEDFSGLAN